MDRSCYGADVSTVLGQIETWLNGLSKVGPEPARGKQLEVELMKPNITLEFDQRMIREMVFLYLKSIDFPTEQLENGYEVTVERPCSHCLLVEFTTPESE